MKKQTKQLLTTVGYILFIILTGYFVFNYFFINPLNGINYIGVNLCLLVWSAFILRWVWEKIERRF